MEPVKNPNQSPTPEQPSTPAEQLPQPSQAAPAGPAPATPTVATPPPAQPQSTPSPAPTQATPKAATPATAEDVDVIEKEWVEAAQAVVKQSADDPHQEEEGFENLQVDYLKKRYGKDIKKAEE